MNTATEMTQLFNQAGYYAQLFDCPSRGQLLVLLDANDQGKPEIRFYAQPKGLGLCSVGMEFTDTDKGWQDAGKAFDRVDLETAILATEPLFEFSTLTAEVAA